MHDPILITALLLLPPFLATQDAPKSDRIKEWVLSGRQPSQVLSTAATGALGSGSFSAGVGDDDDDEDERVSRDDDTHASASMQQPGNMGYLVQVREVAWLHGMRGMENRSCCLILH